jgi:hypothetical protein
MASLATAAAASSCVGDDTAGKDSGTDGGLPPGSEGGPCLSNGTCNQGLVCVLENGNGVCRTPDAGADGAPNDAGPDAPGDAASDAPSDAVAVVCTNAGTGQYVGTFGVAARVVGTYSFKFVGPYDGGAVFSVACDDASAPFEPAWHCAADAATVLSRPADYGTPPDAGRTLTATPYNVTGSTCSADIEVTAP